MIPPKDQGEPSLTTRLLVGACGEAELDGRCDAYQHGPVTCVISSARFFELLHPRMGRDYGLRGKSHD